MPEYVLRLIAEAENHIDALEYIVDGEVPRKGDTFTLEKEYPACIVTYCVTNVSPVNIKIPKNPLPADTAYPTDMQIVSALRELGGFLKN